MFVDEVIISVTGGNGGDGCLAFRREKYVPMGGPFGGNGGRGSNIIFKVDTGLHTLIDLRYMKTITGDKGENGEGKNRNGKNAENVYIKVPQGTIVTDNETGLVLADLREDGDEVVVAYGGRGGRGNTAFKTQSNPAPNYAENGEPGEKRILKVELKLLADVGLVGLPSVGKSTIISKISASKPKIAAYHFTTLTPNLGVVRANKGRSYVVADLPGLIEGASLGEGLGDKFLKHIERTRVIAHVIDMGGTEGRNPVDDYNVIRKELEQFDPSLLNRPEIILANKMDTPDAAENLKEFKNKVKNKDIYEISAIKGEGLEVVINHIADILDTIKAKPLVEEEKYESYVLYKFKQEEPYTITRDTDGTWLIKGKEIEKLLQMTKFNTEEAISRFAKKLRKMGIDDNLVKLGVQEGDKVRILDFEFEFR